MADLRVFLCHASEDKLKVKQLYVQLLMDNFRPWLDTEELLPGQDWSYEIRKAVRESHVVVVCLSPNAIHKSGFFQKEISIVLDAEEEKPEATVYLVPAFLEPCAIPERIRKWHCVDLTSDEGYENHKGYERLLATLRSRAKELGLQTTRRIPKMSPGDRLRLITRVVMTRDIFTIEQLQSELRDAGLPRACHLLSKDLEILDLHMTRNGYRKLHLEPVESVFQECLLDIRLVGNVLWLKTLPGYAAALGYAIERENWPEVVGCLAGDDTVLVMTDNIKSSRRLKKRLQTYRRCSPKPDVGL